MASGAVQSAGCLIANLGWLLSATAAAEQAIIVTASRTDPAAGTTMLDREDLDRTQPVTA